LISNYFLFVSIYYTKSPKHEDHKDLSIVLFQISFRNSLYINIT